MNKRALSLFVVILALLFYSSCSKDIIQDPKPSDPRDGLVGVYNFDIANHYLEFEIDTIRTNHPPGFVCNYRYTHVFKNYTSRGSVVKSDSSHQFLVYWGHDTIPISNSYSPTRINMVNGDFQFENKLSLSDYYFEQESLKFVLNPFGSFGWTIKGKKIK